MNDSLNLLNNALSVCGDHGLVRQWWIIRLTKHLLHELRYSSFHEILPMNSPLGRIDLNYDREWQNMRWQFITSLMMRDKAEIDLWPSQIEGAKRAVNDNDSIVVSLPTSAGKTRVAELSILRCLSVGKRVIFITPLRALSAQTEVSLRKTFSPLGKKVSSLYGSIGISNLEQDVMRTSDIVVGTPEKLDFALRNDLSLLDDVGLIVLDEGHMIGLGSREVSYEVQIQRLLRRPDANQRRIICLSAILPDGDQFEDFVNWLQNDSSLPPIQSEWRPTELRFGTINWHKSFTKARHGYARINFTVEGQEAFIPRFLESFVPPKKSRRIPFPQDKPELTIASAFKLLEDGHTVLIYCTQKDSVNSLAKQIVDLDSRGALIPKINIDESKIALAIALGKEWLGEEHEIIECLKIGVAVHHGSLPTSFRKEVEQLLREGVLKITISSPTLAQGLNLSATAIIIYSLTRFNGNTQAVIDISEFKNVIGRAGRAYVDTHGLVLYPIWEESNLLYGNYWQNETIVWRDLISSNQARDMESGLLELIIEIADLVITLVNNPETLNPIFREYFLNNREAFPVREINEEDRKSYEHDFKGYVSLLDVALFSSLGKYSQISIEGLPQYIDEIFRNSLLYRRMNKQPRYIQTLIHHILQTRSEYVWDNSTFQQRQGYFFAGVGFDTGKKLDQVANKVNKLLLMSNGYIQDQNINQAIESILQLAQIIFKIDPFVPRKVLPQDWEDILKLWLQGKNILEENFHNLEDTLEFIEDGLVYRLPWGLEAIKVRAIANNEISAEVGDQLDLVVPAIESGTLNRQAAMLMQAGFNSRLAATLAVESTQASFDSLNGLKDWLESPQVKFLSDNLLWPTPETNKLWKDFCAHEAVNLQKKWRSEHKMFFIDLAVNNVWEQTVKLVQSGNVIAILNTRGDVLRYWQINWSLDEKGIYLAKLRGNQLDVTYYGFSDHPFPL